MAKVKIQGNASGTGILTVTAPNTSTDRTITLPDGTGTLIADDGAGNVMVGTTDTVPSNNGAGGDAGVAISSDGAFRAARSGNVSLDINRMDSDGDIAAFRKNGATVGSIGVTSSDQFYIARTTGSQGIKFKNSATMPCASSGNDADNAQDLGSSSVRWKDLYLSGGLKVGGTDAAHTLDDYEEGTFTPTFVGGTNPTVTYHEKQGYYTKIGNLVYIRIWMRTASMSNTGTSTLYIDGLPFTVASSNQSKGGIAKGHIQNWGTIPENLFFFGGASSIYLWDETNGTTHKTNILTSGADKNQISCGGFYEVA